MKNKISEEYSFLNFGDHERINKIGKAISHPIRTRIMAQLHEYPKTISEIAKLNDISIKDALFHVNVLVESGIVKKISLPADKNGVNIYAATSTDIYLNYAQEDVCDIETYTQEIPVGMYADARFDSVFRMASQKEVIRLDEKDAFNPIRKEASLLWTNGGMVTYSFGKNFSTTQHIESINFSFEICSETNGFRNDYKSDITISVNGIKLGIFTCDGDFGDIEGKCNPPFWGRTYTQYGHLLVINITNDGTYINHRLVSKITIEDIKLNEHDDLRLTIENERNAKHYGGFNLFGKGFGNYDQDILLTVNYDLASKNK